MRASLLGCCLAFAACAKADRDTASTGALASSCQDDVPDPAAAPGASAVYFSMPAISAEEVDCRTVASGGVEPVGRLALALWQMGKTANQTPVSQPLDQLTGFAPSIDDDLARWQRGPNDEPMSSAIQLRDREVGLWINSDSHDVPYTGEILPVVAYLDFPDGAAPHPFATAGTELSYAGDVRIPTAHSWGTGVPYAAMVFRFRDTRVGNEGRDVWFSMVLFDPRGAPTETVMIDGCSTCSGFPIIMTSVAPGQRFGTPAPGSAAFSAKPWSGLRHFDFRVSEAQLAAALAETKVTYGLDDRQLSPLASDYALVHFNLNPEVYAPPGVGGGAIGLSARNLTIAAYPHPSPARVDHVYINAANASSVPILQIFFKTATADFYDEQKSLRVPFPMGGGNSTVVVDFSQHPDWHGTVTGLRVDPFDSRDPSACFNVDWLYVGDAAGHYAAWWDFNEDAGTPVAPYEGWRFSGIERLWNQDGYWGGCQSDGDPYFYAELQLATGR